MLRQRQLVLPSTHGPGERWFVGAPYPRTKPADGETWCPDVRITYYFVSPIDPETTSTGNLEVDPGVNIDSVELIETLADPCWPAKAGNVYEVVGDRP